MLYSNSKPNNKSPSERCVHRQRDLELTNASKIRREVGVKKKHQLPSGKSNIAIENGPFIVDLPLNIVIFHSYVSLTEGNYMGVS